MASTIPAHPRRRLYRLALLVLVIVPFIPEIIIIGTIAVAKLMGCEPEQKNLCLIGSLPPSEIIRVSLQATATFIITHAGNWKWLVGMYLAIAAWLVACWIVLFQGWTRVPSRLMLGFVIALAFAVLPYFGPMLSIANLVHENCRPNEGGAGPCVIFGGHVAPAHDAVLMGWLVLIGAPLALGMFVLYAVVVIAAAVWPEKRPLPLA